VSENTDFQPNTAYEKYVKSWAKEVLIIILLLMIVNLVIASVVQSAGFSVLISLIIGLLAVYHFTKLLFENMNDLIIEHTNHIESIDNNEN